MIKFHDRTQKAIAITEVQLRIADLQVLKEKYKHKLPDAMRETERIANIASFSMSIEALNQTLIILRQVEAEHAPYSA